MGNKILTWLGVIGGSFAAIGGLAFVLSLYVNSIVDARLENARPPSVQKIEQDIAVMKNDISHIRDDVATTTELNRETNRIFREYLESQQR